MKVMMIVTTVGLTASWLASGSGAPAGMEGSWESTGHTHITMTLEAKGSTIEGSGRILPDSATDCAAEISLLRLSRSKEKYLGTLRASGDCAGEKMTLDCELSSDGAKLDCGKELQFQRR